MKNFIRITVLLLFGLLLGCVAIGSNEGGKVTDEQARLEKVGSWINSWDAGRGIDYQGDVTRDSQFRTKQKVYRQDECIGAIVNGVCHGSILPKSGYRPTCYGQMLSGRCTGPMF